MPILKVTFVATYMTQAHQFDRILEVWQRPRWPHTQLVQAAGLLLALYLMLEYTDSFTFSVGKSSSLSSCRNWAMNLLIRLSSSLELKSGVPWSWGCGRPRETVCILVLFPGSVLDIKVKLMRTVAAESSACIGNYSQFAFLVLIQGPHQGHARSQLCTQHMLSSGPQT